MYISATFFFSIYKYNMILTARALLATTVRQTSSLIAEGKAAAKFVLTQPSGQHSKSHIYSRRPSQSPSLCPCPSWAGEEEGGGFGVWGQSVNIATTISISISIRAARLGAISVGPATV